MNMGNLANDSSLTLNHKVKTICSMYLVEGEAGIDFGKRDAFNSYFTSPMRRKCRFKKAAIKELKTTWIINLESIETKRTI